MTKRFFGLCVLRRFEVDEEDYDDGDDGTNGATLYRDGDDDDGDGGNVFVYGFVLKVTCQRHFRRFPWTIFRRAKL